MGNKKRLAKAKKTLKTADNYNRHKNNRQQTIDRVKESMKEMTVDRLVPELFPILDKYVDDGQPVIADYPLAGTSRKLVVRLYNHRRHEDVVTISVMEDLENHVSGLVDMPKDASGINFDIIKDKCNGDINLLNLIHFHALIHPVVKEKQEFQKLDALLSTEVNSDSKSDSDSDLNLNLVDLRDQFRSNITKNQNQNPNQNPNLDSEDSRKSDYLANLERGYPENLGIIRELVQRSKAKAQEHGYENWAQYEAQDFATEHADGLTSLKEWLINLEKEYMPLYQKEIELLKSLNTSVELKPWNLSYLVRQAKAEAEAEAEAKAETESEMEKDTITIDSALEKLNELGFPVSFKVENTKYLGIDFKLINISENSGTSSASSVIGRILVDYSEHRDKYLRGLAVNVINRNSKTAGLSMVSLPIVNPENLSYSELRTLYNELGHGIHYAVNHNPDSLSRRYTEIPANMLVDQIDNLFKTPENQSSDLTSFKAHQLHYDLKNAWLCLSVFEGKDLEEFPQNDQKSLCQMVQLFTQKSAYYNYLIGDYLAESIKSFSELYQLMISGKWSLKIHLN